MYDEYIYTKQYNSINNPLYEKHYIHNTIIHNQY